MKNIINQKQSFLYVILVFLILAPVAEGAALDLCEDPHHVDIGADLDLGCCDSSFNETEHCHDAHINSRVFLSTNNIRTSFQSGLAKLFLYKISILPILDFASNIYSESQTTLLPDELSYKSTIVLLI